MQTLFSEMSIKMRLTIFLSDRISASKQPSYAILISLSIVPLSRKKPDVLNKTEAMITSQNITELEDVLLVRACMA